MEYKNNGGNKKHKRKKLKDNYEPTHTKHLYYETIQILFMIRDLFTF